MTSRCPVDALTSRYDAFLYAPLGEDGGTPSLSVLSALARLNVDPWREAEELAELPAPAATQRLTSLFELLPAQTLVAGDVGRLAAGMIALLPNAHGQAAGSDVAQGNAPAAPSGRAVPSTGAPTKRWVLFYVVVMAILIGTEYVMSNRQAPEEPANATIEDNRPLTAPVTGPATSPSSAEKK